MSQRQSRQLVALESYKTTDTIEAIEQLKDFATLEYLIVSDCREEIQIAAWERMRDLFPRYRYKNVRRFIFPLLFERKAAKFKHFINHFSGSPCTRNTPKELKRENGVHWNAEYFPPSQIHYKQFDEKDFDARKKLHWILKKYLDETPYAINYAMYQYKASYMRKGYSFTPYIVIIRTLNEECEYEYYLAHVHKS